jgi:hypothetical protein
MVLTERKSGMLSETVSLKIIVTLFVYKKQNMLPLILPSYVYFALLPLSVSNSSFLMVLLEDRLSFRKV